MTRRKFLLGAVATAAAPAIVRAQVPAAWKWVLPGEATGFLPAETGLVRPATSLHMPPPGVPIHSFKPASGPIIRRPRWSELKQPENHDLACKVEADLDKAYDKMLALPDSHCHSLYFQMRLHDYNCSPANGGDLHTTWNFLPWHRAFVYFHERIVANYAGNQSFRMPAWDWEIDPTLPDYYTRKGVPSFFTSPFRRPEPNLDNVRHNVGIGATQSWLLSKSFTDMMGSADPGSPRCNGGPHTAVHRSVVQGPMTASDTAAGDPIFYAHHANVDKCFSYWLQKYPDTGDYARPPQWRNTEFCFYDENCRLVRVQTAQLLDETKLGYTYEKQPTFKLYEFSDQPLQKELWSDPARLAGLLERLLKGIAKLGLSTAQTRLAAFERFQFGYGEAVYLPVRVRLTIDSQFLDPNSFFEVFVQNADLPAGASEAPVGGFGFFGHSHLTGPNTEVVVPGSLNWNILRVLASTTPIRPRARSIKLLIRRSGAQPGERQIEFGPLSEFRLLVPVELKNLL